MLSCKSLSRVLIASVGIVASVGPLYSATFVVSSTADSGGGTLRQAILDANFAAGDDTIEITTTGTIALSSLLPLIADNTVLNGPGTNQLTISGNNAVQIFSMKSGTTNIVNGVSLSGGRATNDAHGAAISNAGDLTVMNCAIVDNTTISGLGGGIYNAGNLTVLNSTIARNSVRGSNGASLATESYGGRGGGGGGLGGGLFTTSGRVVISNSTVRANNAFGGNGSAETGTDQSGAGANG